MITSITYNCTPDSLGDVDPVEFADAFERVVRAAHRYRECQVSVTFGTGLSEVVSVETDGCHNDPRDYDEEITYCAERAFDHILN